MRYYSLLLFLVCTSYTYSLTPIVVGTNDSDPGVMVTIRNVTLDKGVIKQTNKPHHLFIGRCNSKYGILHQEHIIVTNDGKSHVSSNIRMNVEWPVYITCVNIYDEVPDGKGGYPSFSAGGVGHNFIEFNVLTNYGEGFHFYVEIYGYTKNQTDKRLNF